MSAKTHGIVIGIAVIAAAVVAATLDPGIAPFCVLMGALGAWLGPMTNVPHPSEGRDA